MYQKLLSELRVIPDDITEAIELFKLIPNDDPLKYSFYKNIETLLLIEIEREKESKIKIRLLNNYASGLINLDQLAQTAKYVQQAYTSAFGKKLGIIDGRSKKFPLLMKESRIIASMDAGSFILNIDKIGDDLNGNTVDMFLSEVDKEELFIDFLTEVWEIDRQSEEYQNDLIDKYGYKSLQNIEKWFNTLSEYKTSFELINRHEEQKVFSIEKINTIKNTINKFEFEEQYSRIKVSGKLLKIDTIKNKILIRDLTQGDIEIAIQSGLLQLNEIGDVLRVNKEYFLNVIKHEKKYPAKSISKYELENVDELIELK